MPDDGLAEVLLAAEVVVEQPARDAGLLGQDVDRELVDGSGGEEPGPEVEELETTLLRGEAHAGGAHDAHLIDAYSIAPVRWPTCRPSRPRSPTSSSAPASPGSAWRSSSTRTARPTSSSSRRAPTSAAPGATTPTPAPPATSRASSTPSPSRPTPTGRRSFSPQPEIHAYLRRVARESGVLDRFAFDTDARGGAVRRAGAALGGAHQPRRGHRHHADQRRPAGSPSPGCPTSTASRPSRASSSTPPAGTTTSTSPASGSPSSAPAPRAIQIVPEVAKVAGHLDVYQRTAPYVIPRNDRRYTRLERLLFRHVPAVQKVYRTATYWAPRVLRPRLHLAARGSRPRRGGWRWPTSPGASPTPRCGSAVTPDFEIGCKRILISNNYYPALAAGPRRPRHRPDRQGHRRRDRHRRRHRAPGRRAGRRHRLPHHRAADRRAHPRPRWAARSPRCGATPGWRRTRARPSTASPTSSCSSAPTPGWATPAWSS